MINRDEWRVTGGERVTLTTRHWCFTSIHSVLRIRHYLTISKYILTACPPRGAASFAPNPPG